MIMFLRARMLFAVTRIGPDPHFDFKLAVADEIEGMRKRDRTRAAAAAYYRMFEANRGLMKCLVNHLDEFPETRDAFQTLNREWVETVVAAAEKKLARMKRAGEVSRNELMRRAYALGGMVDQYLTALFLSKDRTLVSVSHDPKAVIDTIPFFWKRGLGS